MALEINGISIYTVKFVDAEGRQHMKDYQAVGTSDAKDKFMADYPTAQLINIFRKS